jgi:hypothetical protein
MTKLSHATDVRLYTYRGYGVLSKIKDNKIHKNKSYTEAVTMINYARATGKAIYQKVQFVMIDYTNDKIIHITDPNV